MAENLRDVIARIKQQNSQQQAPVTPQVEKPKVAEVPAPIPVEDEDFDEEFQEDPTTEEKTVEKSVNSKNIKSSEDQANTTSIIQQIDALQNNGVFRLELLSQLNEIKQALVIIAGQLVDLNGKK